MTPLPIPSVPSIPSIPPEIFSIGEGTASACKSLFGAISEIVQSNNQREIASYQSEVAMHEIDARLDLEMKKLDAQLTAELETIKANHKLQMEKLDSLNKYISGQLALYTDMPPKIRAHAAGKFAELMAGIYAKMF